MSSSREGVCLDPKGLELAYEANNAHDALLYGQGKEDYVTRRYKRGVLPLQISQDLANRVGTKRPTPPKKNSESCVSKPESL